MIVTGLNLSHIRAIERADFRFQPGFNLIVGVNGVGKSTVLDAVRIAMSRILPSATESRARAMSFATRDIRSGLPFLDAKLSITIEDDKFDYTRRQWRETFAADDVENIKRLRREILASDRLRDRARNLLRELETSQGVADSDFFARPKAALRRAARSAVVAPNCVFFSTSRSTVSNKSPRKSKTAAGKAAAYAGSLAPRPLYLAQLADWMRVQEALAKEQSIAKRHLRVMRSAVERFLPGYDNLRPAGATSAPLRISQNGITLAVGQLSDGERGLLAVVLDLARCLSQANPGLDDPLKEGHAVVLIDELELHLHPKWQREVVHHLKATFPLCQFIATTHSPQVIGEVPHDRIQILADGQVHSPTHALGVDANRVLEEIMDAPPRNEEVEGLLETISRDIGNQRYSMARASLVELAGRLGENDPEITRIRAILDFIEGGQ